MNENPLTEYQHRVLEQVRSLVPVESLSPWMRRERGFGDERLLAAGWTRDESLLFVSYDRFSLRDPRSAETLLHRDMEESEIYRCFSPDRLAFTLPNGEMVHVFGLYGGDGLLRTDDGWSLEVVAPWWPLEAVLLCPPRGPRAGHRLPYEGCTMLDTAGMGGDWLKCGFSVSGRLFAIVDPQGALVFTR